MLHAAKHVNGKILWANLHLLFWLSLVPFVTGWMGENHFGKVPVAFYGFVQLMAAIAYYILGQTLIRHHDATSTLATSIGRDIKGKISIIIYLIATLLSFVNQWLAFGLYVAVAVLWFIPDRRIEMTLEK